MFNFEKLEVWQKARRFAKRVYEVTDAFPEKEKFGLTQHTRKTTVSISSNIAEGSSRLSSADFQRFIQVATGSVQEIVAQLYVALDVGYLDQESFENLYRDAEELSKMLSGLSRSLARRETKLSSLNSQL